MCKPDFTLKVQFTGLYLNIQILKDSLVLIHKQITQIIHIAYFKH